MKKIFSLLAAVLFAGSMMADSYTIEFKDNGTASDGNAGLTSTTVADYVATGAEYVSAIAATGKVYNAQTGYGLKFGNNSNPGAVTLTLATPVKPTSIVMNASQWGSTEGSGLLQDSTIDMTAGGGKGKFNDYAYTYDGNTEVTTIVVGTKAKRGFVKSVTVNFEGGVTPPQPAIASPYCQTEVGHFFAANADPNSFVLLSIGSKGGKTIVRIDQDAAKNTQMFDYLQVTGLASEGADVAEGGAAAMAVEFDTPTAVNDSITLEILWSTVNWEGRWMVQNVKVPATAECEYAVLVPAPVVKKTCAEVYSLAKNDAVALNDVVVTYVNGKNVWVKDATASMLVFLPAASDAFKAGDVLSEVAGVVDIYNGVYEVKPTADQVTAIVATPGEAPAAELVAEVALTDVNKYIVMQNVEFAEDAAFAEGTQSNITINGVVVRNQFKNGYSFTAGKKYNIYGVVTIYSSNPQVYFITAEEVSATAINNTTDEIKTFKTIENGQLVIIKNGVRYDATGALIR